MVDLPANHPMGFFNENHGFVFFLEEIEHLMHDMNPPGFDFSPFASVRVASENLEGH